MPKLVDVFEEFIIDCQLRNLKQTTISTYIEVWNRFIKSIDFEETDNLNNSTFKFYTKEMLDDELSPHYINKNLRHLRAIVNWMADEEQQIILPLKIKLINAPTKPKEVFSKEEQIRLTNKPILKDNPSEWRNWLTANILLHTGMRGATLRQMNWEDIRVHDRVLVLNETKKNGRVIPMSLELTRVISIYKRKFKPIDSEPVIKSAKGIRLSKSSMDTVMRRYHRSRGVECCSIHQYRRTFITEAVARGVDVVKIARMVGHTDLQMINKHYLSDNVELLRSVVE